MRLSMLKAKVPDMEQMDCRYLIIGNSAAGVTAAETIRRYDRDSSIIIVGDEPYAAYGRPLISYMVEGKTTRQNMDYKSPSFYEDNSITALLGSDFKAVELDPSSHVVKLEGGMEIHYGKCLIATGSIPFTPPIPGLDKAANVFTFITLDDAQSVWDKTMQATQDAHSQGLTSRVVVVGSGLIGLKAAEALTYHADEVAVLELAPRILPAVLDDEGSTILATLLAKRGIRCFPGVSAESFVLDEGNAVAAQLTDGATLDCDVVIAAVGVRPNSELAVRAGAKEGRGLICDSSLRTTLPDVYAAGDVTQVKDILDESLHPLALWPNAIKQGKIAGQQMADVPDAECFDGNFAVNAVDFFDITLLTSGVINPPEDAAYEIKTVSQEDKYAKFVMRDGRLVGYILMNRPANAGIYTALIESGIPVSQLDPQVFEDTPQNLDFPPEVRWSRLHRNYPSNLDKSGWKKESA